MSESHLTVVRRLASAQKTGVGVPAYTRWVNRRLARHAAAAAHRAGLSPNAVSAVSAVVSSIAIALLLLVDPSVPLGIGVAVLLATGYMLDSADGQVARLSGRSSPAGEWLDHVIDAIRMPAIHLAVLVASARLVETPRWFIAVIVGFALCEVGQFMSQVLGDQLVSRAGGSPIDASAGPRRSLALIPVDTGTFCWLFVLWGWRDGFEVAYTVLFVINVAYALISMRRKFVRLNEVAAARPGGSNG